ncbi:MAG TPA: FAD-binding protein, partial [Chloroflexota bacterium]|nr:FAD-binding protein [Chloroflexota bacterium]
HYMMGGVRVDADTAATSVSGLFAAGEVAAGLHGANRLGGNSLSDLLVFGRRAGQYAAEYARSRAGLPSVNPEEVEYAAHTMLSPFESGGGENPFSVHLDLQKSMQALVGIIRTESELRQALDEIAGLKQRLERVSVPGNRQYNSAWHQALDLEFMLTVSEAITLAAIERKESRGGHTRDDYPAADAALARVNVVTRRSNGEITSAFEPLADMPEELKQIIEDKS